MYIRILVSALSFFSFYLPCVPQDLHSFPTRRSSDLTHFPVDSRNENLPEKRIHQNYARRPGGMPRRAFCSFGECAFRSEEHTSELQSLRHLVCRLLLEKKKKKTTSIEKNNTNHEERD